jgi:hypothetical protein
MAGDWMKVELTLPDKPEVHYIASVLNLDPDAVLGKLLRVWRWFNENTVDGCANLATFATVDRLASAPGFAEAMHFAGWLKQDGKTLIMPSFERHTSTSAKKRAEAAIRMHKSRVKTIDTADTCVDVAQNAQQKRNSSATKAQPEKRREEKEKREEREECATADEPFPVEDEKSEVRDSAKAELPRPLDVPAFREAWGLWERYRVDSGHGCVQPMSRLQVWHDLAKFGALKAESLVRHAIAKGWKQIHYDAKVPDIKPPPDPHRIDPVLARLRAEDAAAEKSAYQGGKTREALKREAG